MEGKREEELPLLLPSTLPPALSPKSQEAATTKEELRTWLRIAIPSGLTITGWLSTNLVDTAFLGHLGTKYLAAGATATLWQTVAGWWIIQGFAGAVAALVSQALGAENPKLAGTWLQIAQLSLLVVSVPVSVAFWFTEDVLSAVGFDADQSKLAGSFSRWSVLAVVPNLSFSMYAAFLQAQGIVLPALVTAGCAFTLNVFFNVLFIHGTRPFGGSSDGLGFSGSPIATALTRWVALVGFLTYCFWYKRLHAPTWPGWTTKYFTKRRWREFLLEQAIPSSISVAIEEWQIQTITFFAARLGSAEISAHNSLMMLLLLLSSMCYGYMDATSIRVAFYVGASNIEMAKRVARISLLMSLVTGVAVAILLASFRSYLPKVFSSDPEVIRQADRLVYLCAASYLLICFFFTSLSILSGQARPTPVMVAFLIGCWCVGVPTSYVFCHPLNLGLRGLWLGMILGYLVTTGLSVFAVLRTDWHKVVADAVSRAAASVLSPNAGSLNSGQDKDVLASPNEGSRGQGQGQRHELSLPPGTISEGASGGPAVKVRPM